MPPKTSHIESALTAVCKRSAHGVSARNKVGFAASDVCRDGLRHIKARPGASAYRQASGGQPLTRTPHCAVMRGSFRCQAAHCIAGVGAQWVTLHPIPVAPQTSLFYKDNTMNKLLAALVATVFSAGAFAQASAPAAAPAPAAAAPAPAASAPAAGEKATQLQKKKKKRDHRPKHQDKSAYGVGG